MSTVWARVKKESSDQVEGLVVKLNKYVNWHLYFSLKFNFISLCVWQFRQHV